MSWAWLGVVAGVVASVAMVCGWMGYWIGAHKLCPRCRREVIMIDEMVDRAVQRAEKEK
jgi:hypothetical protein